jgi:multidrug resistance efflux pump
VVSAPQGDFLRSLRALDDLGGRRRLWVALASLALLGVWAAWFLLARVTVFAVSDSARVEVDRAARPVAAPVVGRVAEVHLGVGREVRDGEVLVRLEDAAERHRLEEGMAHAAAMRVQLEALRREQDAGMGNLRERVEGLRAAVAETRQRLAATEARERLAASELARVTRLGNSGLVAAAEVERARDLLDAAEAAAEELRSSVDRVGWELQVGESELRTREEGMRRELGDLAGAEAAARAAVERLAAELAKLTLRAPVAGTLGEAADLERGAVVQEGERVAVVVPPSELRVVALFSPAAAWGRVRPDQRARLRLYGFPWAEFGTVPASVERVATELRDGRVRVELRVQPAPGSRIPLQHGLPGVVEVEVEEASPATLALRAAGRRLGLDEPAHPADAPSAAGPS